MSLQVVTPPTSEPVALADVKARLRLTSTADDATITSQITQAREFCERVSRRSLAYKSYALFLDRFPYPHEPIRLPAPPLVSVSNVFYYDSTLTQQTWSPSEYWWTPAQSPALIVPKPGLIYPSPAHIPGAVEVDFTAGWGYPGNPDADPVVPAGPALPADWARCIQDVAMFIYENPSTPIPEALCSIPKVWVF